MGRQGALQTFGPAIYLDIYLPMNFITFNDFLNCVYVPPTEANQRPSPDEVLEGLLTIYSGEQPDLNPNENIARKTVQGLKVIGAGVVKVRAANDPSVFTVLLVEHFHTYDITKTLCMLNWR